ncbi:MAG: TIM barrel protein [Gemmatimonadaceae bacterium]|nr:TIM barrel protein [Gemmatimonadaceae bacterium]
MERREFLAAAAVAGLGVTDEARSLTRAGGDAQESREAAVPPSRGAPAPGRRGAPAPTFGLDFAPHFGMFQRSAGDDLVAQLRWMHEAGFRALEDNGMRGRPVAEQERIGAEMARLGMRMGVFVLNPETAWTTTFAAGEASFRESFLKDVDASIEVAKRVNAKWATVVLGTVAPRLEPEYQTANAVEILRAGAERCEKAGLVMVLEPLNRRDHPNLFLTRIPQAFQICRAVDSPSCKILFDIYHQQITEGNLIPNFDAAWREVAYVQVGDNPGRKEPTTGEINYAGVFAHLKRKGYAGVIGMEHGNSRPGAEGEQAVVAAYRAVDPR